MSGHIDHGGFVDDEKIGIERIVLILAKASGLGIDLKQPMDRLRLVPRRLAHALGGASRRRAEKHLHILRFQDAQDRIHNRRLADARAAGDDENFRAKRELDRLLLTVGEREGRFGREPVDRLGGVDLRPGRLSGREPQDALRDPLLGLVKPGEKNALCFLDAVFHDCLFGKLERHGRLDECRRHFEQLFGERRELVHGKAAMAVIQRFGERIRNPGSDPDHGGFLDAKPGRDCVRRFEADAPDVLRQPVRVFRHELHGIVAVGLVDAHRARCADAMRMQKDHDLADDFLLGPGGNDALGAARADAVDLAQALRRTLDDIEDLVAERLNEPFGIDGADAADHARGEVFLHALDRGRLRGFQELRPELQPVRAVILPGPARRHPFAGRDRRRMAKDGDQVLLPAHFHAEHAKAVLLVVKGHPLHKAGKNLLFVRGRHQPLSSHANQMRLRVFFPFEKCREPLFARLEFGSG